MSGAPLLPGTAAPCWDVLPSPQACWLEGQHDLLLGQSTNPEALAPSGASTPELCLLSLSSSASHQALGDSPNFIQRAKPRPLSQKFTHLRKTDTG